MIRLLRMILCVLLCFSVLIFGNKEGFAANFTGAYLLHVCEKNVQGKTAVAGGHTACQAYIAGVIDYHRVLQSLKIAPQVDICIPAHVNAAQLHDVVLDYLRKSPEHDSFTAAPAVTMALYSKFPCK